MNNGFRPGWEFFDDLEAGIKNVDETAHAAEIENIRQLRLDYQAVFGTDAAKRVMQDLKKRYSDPPVLQGYYPDGINTAIAMAVRSAQQELINKLATIIKPGE